MDNNPNNNIPRPGAESLNERLRRAAEMARRNISAEPTAPHSPAPSQPTPQTPPQPAPQRPTPPVPPPTSPAPSPAPIPTPSPTPAPHVPGPEGPGYGRPVPPPPGQSFFGGNNLPPQGTPPRPPQSPRPVPPRPIPPAPPAKSGGKTKLWMILLGVLLLLAVGALVFIMSKNSADMEAQQQQIEQLQLQNQQIQLANEYESLNNEFAQYENQTSLLANDSIVQKYAAARAQVEKLLNELKNEKNKSAAQIAQLKGEIETLKTILRSYVEQINELQKENQTLRDENAEVKAQNTQLSQTVQSVQASNEKLNERMTLAEKLNVTGVNLIPLNKKGKREKNVTKARQLEVTFTIPQNNSTPVGEKTIYLRLTSPEGELLGNGGSFTFEGASLRCTARKTIEYQGEEIGGIKIYWDVNATLTPGDYTVELFADNYRLASRRFTLKK